MRPASDLRPADLPRWIACPLARVTLVQEPAARFKRVLELAEAYLEYTCVLGLSALNGVDGLDANLDPGFGEKLRQNLNKVMSTGDWVKVFAHVRGELARWGRLGTKIDAIGLEVANGEPIAEATSALTGALVAKPSVGALFDAMVPARNEFSHRTVDDARASQLATLLLDALQVLISDTAGIWKLPLVWVTAAERRVVDGKEKFVVGYHVLNGTGLPEARERVTERESTSLSTGSLYFWDERSVAYQVPKWLAVYDPHRTLLTMFQGVHGGQLVHHSRTTLGIVNEWSPDVAVPVFLSVDAPSEVEASETAFYNLQELLAEHKSLETALTTSVADPLRTREAVGAPSEPVVATRFAALLLEDGPSPFVSACLELGGREEVIFGRDPGERGVRIDHLSVSRKHASFRVDRGRLQVSDLRSRNGVAVNGTVVLGTTVVLPGDQVQVGPYAFRVEVVDASASNRLKRVAALATSAGHDVATGLVLPRGIPGMVREAFQAASVDRAGLIGVRLTIGGGTGERTSQAVLQAVARWVLLSVPDPERVALGDQGDVVLMLVGMKLPEVESLISSIGKAVSLHPWDRVEAGLVVGLDWRVVEYASPESLSVFVGRVRGRG